MPEVIEVRKQVEKLQYWRGKQIVSIEYDEFSKFNKKEIPGWELLHFPLKINDIFSRGKIIVFVCENLFITSHLGMSGFYTTNKGKHSNLWFDFGSECLYYDDQRHFGNFTICSDLSDIWKKNGPCLLTSALVRYGKLKHLNEHEKIINRKMWHNCFQESKKTVKICEFLLEQKRFSGIGNYCRCEIMYFSGIHPERILSSLSEKEIDILYEKTMEVIYLYYKSLNSSDQLAVYNKSHDPYGNPVSICKIKGRTVYYSSKYQK